MREIQFADQLRRRRLALGWSQVKLAMRIRAAAEAAGAGTPLLDANTVSRWERGFQWPDAFYQRLICEVLVVSPENIGLIGDPSPTMAAKSRNGAPETATAPLTLLGLDAAWVVLDRRRSVNTSVLAEVSAVTSRLHEHYDTLPPRQLLPAVQRYLRRLQVTRMSRSSAENREFMSMTGEATVMAGSLAHRLHNFGDAESHYRIAQDLANRNGDAHLRALALTARSAVYSNIDSGRPAGRPGIALALLDTAAAATGRSSSPYLRSWLLARRASEHAAEGNRRAAFNDLDRAAQAAASATHAGTGFFAGWTEERLAGYRGCCAVLLRTRDAVTIQEDAAAHVGPAMISQHSAVLIDLATAYARSRRPDDACALLSSTLDVAAHAHLPEIVRRVMTVRRYDLDGWKRLPGVRRLDEQLRSMILSPRISL
jgi:transcriptional regulator with XRE-family HTH domain